MRVALLRAVISLAMTIGFAVSPAMAQDVVGTAIVNGKRVQLLSDQSWRYSDGQNQSFTDGCRRLHSRVRFCGNARFWKTLQGHEGDLDGFFSFGKRIYAAVLIDEFGKDDGLSRESMRQVILENAAETSNVRVEDIPVLGVFNQTLAHQAAETLIYGARMNGVNTVYVNTSLILEDISIQFVVWQVTREFTPELKMRHEDFISNVKLDAKAQTQ